MKLVFATHNPGKVKEMRQILAGLKIEVVSAEEASIREDVREDGKTFTENSLKKALFFAQKSGHWAVADDSGLCIKALNNRPGVFSARWAGTGKIGEEIVNHTLKKMEGVPKSQRQAWFETVVALASPDGRFYTFSGKIEGTIPLHPAGRPRSKLPYDVIFAPKGYGKTFAQMSDRKKNSLSHRGQAFRQLRKFMEKII